MTNPTTPFSWQMPTATDLVTDLPADFEVFGQAVATSMADLLGGTTGQILAKASNTNMDFTWVTNDVGDITAVTASSPLTGGGTSGAITVGIQDATTSVKGAVQLSDSTSTTSSILAATPTAVKSAYDLATTANTNSNNITMVQQYTATESVLKNIPSRVPVAEQLLKQAVYWIDAAQSDNSDQVLDNQGWGGTSMTTQLGSTASADSNDPKFLDFDGVNYAYMPGSATNYLSTPDATVLDITSDIDLRVYIAADLYSGGGFQTLMSKTDGISNQSYGFGIENSGTITFFWSATGSASLSATSTVSTGITNGTAKWIRATLDVDNGAVGRDIKFYLSNDGITWTQLGSTVTQALTTSIYSGTAPLEIGSQGGGAAGSVLTAKIYRAQVLSGIDGTKVLDVNTSTIGSGSATTFSALTGQTVTINRSTSGKKTAVVTHPVWLFGTDDFMETADNDLLDFSATESFSVVAVFRQWATTADKRIVSKSAASGGGYNLSSQGSNQGYFQINDATFFPTATVSITSGSLSILSGVRNVSTDTVGAYLNTNSVVSTTDTTTGTLADSGTLRIGAQYNGGYVDMEFVAAALFRRVLTAAEITTIYNYYLARVGA
jgi:hypothetical protein